MARGLPDYGLPDYNIAIRQDDFSLIPLTQSGFVSMDGRGRAIWQDDFRDGLRRWSLSKTGTGVLPTHILTSGISFGYNGCAKLDPTASPNTSQMSARFISPISRKMGFETLLYLTTNFPRVELFLYIGRDDNDGYYMFIKIEAATGVITLSHDLGTATIYTPANISYFLNKWVSIKLVGNYDTNTYERVIVGGTQIDLGQYVMNDFTGILKGYTEAIVKVSGMTAPNDDPAYVGAAIVTNDEP